MEERGPVTPVDVLAALADLSPSGEATTSGLTIPTEWFRWLAPEDVAILGTFFDRSHGNVDRAFGERLAALDQIRALQRPLRVGWLFVTGRHQGEDGKKRAVFLPLVSVPVRVRRPLAVGDAELWPAGDVEITDLVTDATARHRLEHVEAGRGAFAGLKSPMHVDRLLRRLPALQAYAHELAAAAGFGEGLRLVAPDKGPEQLLREHDLRIVAGVAVYAAEDLGGTSHASALRAWASRPVEPITAFHAVYGPNDEAEQPTVAEPVITPYVLTPSQTEAVLRSRHAAVTVVSGAPGNGKSHTLAAIVGDAMARGETVLVSAKSDSSVDALIELLERAPGPSPVVFGSAERRERLAGQLAAGQLVPVSPQALLKARSEVVHARDLWTARRAEIRDLLAVEAGRDGDLDDVDAARVLAPGLFDPQVDLRTVTGEVDAASLLDGGWWAARSRRRAWALLLERLGAPSTTDPATLAAALNEARLVRAEADLLEAGGLDLRYAMNDLDRLEQNLHQAVARWLAAESRNPDRLTGTALAAVAALATALRSGRSARRAQLTRMDATLTRALPLWLGTLADIEDLLPPHPGLFDLVVIDEASSIEQPLAVPALLRGRRVVVAGDPQQLRHVSFASDERHREVMAAHGIDQAPLLAARLDVRRNSLFDVAAGAAPVTVLDEHFRSDPHLVDLVARRLYAGRLKIATRTPASACRDCIDVELLEGERNADGVVMAEVHATMRHLRHLKFTGARSVGVITPFRAQADALEAAILHDFTADSVLDLDLRVGTVHAFQGNERDVVILSLGIGPAEGARTWSFVDDPHLFAVLATRARRRMIVLHSAEPPAGGLCADYLALDDLTPGQPPPLHEPRPWTATVAAALAAAEVPVRPSYPMGRHEVDLVLDDPALAVAIDTEVHPDGPDAHIDRRQALDRAGWDVIDAFRSRWEQRPGAMVLDVMERLGRH